MDNGASHPACLGDCRGVKNPQQVGIKAVLRNKPRRRKSSRVMRLKPAAIEEQLRYTSLGQQSIKILRQNGGIRDQKRRGFVVSDKLRGVVNLMIFKDKPIIEGAIA